MKLVGLFFIHNSSMNCSMLYMDFSENFYPYFDKFQLEKLCFFILPPPRFDFDFLVLGLGSVLSIMDLTKSYPLIQRLFHYEKRAFSLFEKLYKTSMDEQTKKEIICWLVIIFLLYIQTI